MTQESEGRNEIAKLVDSLPIRARVCLTLVAADIALQRLRGSPEFDLARDTLDVALNWQKGDRVDLDKWEDLFEDTIGFVSHRAHSRSKVEGLAWRVLEYPICYAAYHAFRAANRPIPLSLPSVDEPILDYLDKDLRALAPSSMALMVRAAAYLKQHPDAPFARLKAQVPGL